jgi:hypothetical protein
MVVGMVVALARGMNATRTDKGNTMTTLTELETIVLASLKEYSNADEYETYGGYFVRDTFGAVAITMLVKQGRTFADFEDGKTLKVLFGTMRSLSNKGVIDWDGAIEALRGHEEEAQWVGFNQ